MLSFRKVDSMNQLANFRIVTNEVKIINHDMDGNFDVSPNINRQTGHIENSSNYFTKLTISFENTEEHPFPIDLSVTMTAIFDLQHLDTDDQEQIERFLRFQGVQTLFPYMRATISNTLSSAMIAPLTLPIVDVYQLFPEDAKYLPETNN